MLVVDPEPVVRESLRKILARGGFKVVAQAKDGASAVEAASRHRPDAVLLELDLPDLSGPEACRGILERFPAAKIIVFSNGADDESMTRAAEAGAWGYVVKDVDSPRLAQVVRQILQEEPAYEAADTLEIPEEEPVHEAAEPAIPEDELAEEAAEMPAQEDAELAAPRLTGQELNVLRLAAEGLTNVEIGARMSLSRHTVKEYLSHAMRKLEVGNRVEAVIQATRLGLLEPLGPTAAEEAAPEPGRAEPLEAAQEVAPEPGREQPAASLREAAPGPELEEPADVVQAAPESAPEEPAEAVQDAVPEPAPAEPTPGWEPRPFEHAVAAYEAAPEPHPSELAAAVQPADSDRRQADPEVLLAPIKVSPDRIWRGRPINLRALADDDLVRRLSAAGAIFTVVFIAVYLSLS